MSPIGASRMSSTESRLFTRLLPDEPFPPYAYVPGRFPQRTSDPAGYSYGIQPVIPETVEPERWRECRPCLHGIDLFNGGFYWESHVAWESLWMACGRRGVVADFLKGLIHLAASGVKALEGKPEGVKSHSARAVELWRKVVCFLGTDSDEFMGFRIGNLIGMAESVGKGGWPAQPPFLMATEGQPR